MSEIAMAQLTDTLLRVRTMPSRLERRAIIVLCAVAISAFPAVAVLAQHGQPQQGQPQQEAPATAPSPGSSASPAPASPSPTPPSPAITSWQQSLVARLARFQRYPAQARGAEGVASLGFRIDRQGHVVSSSIVKSSGSAILDAEAIALVKRAAPFPLPPSAVPDADLSFVVPIHFVAGEKR